MSNTQAKHQAAPGGIDDPSAVKGRQRFGCGPDSNRLTCFTFCNLSVEMVGVQRAVPSRPRVPIHAAAVKVEL